MTVVSCGFGKSDVNGTSDNGVSFGLNCNNKRTNSLITLPVIDTNYYGNQFIYQNIDLEAYQNLELSNLQKLNDLGYTNQDQLSGLNSENMLSLGFNKGFNFLSKKMTENNMNEEEAKPDNLEEAQVSENEEAFNESYPSIKADEHETSSNIDDIFRNVSIDNVKTRPVCNIFGNCLNNKKNSYQASMNYEMFRLTGALSSFFDPPEFVDSDTVVDENLKRNFFSKFFGVFKPKLENDLTNNFNSQHLSSILSQSSLIPDDVGCFSTCNKKLRKYVDLDKLGTFATSTSLGLKNLYHSFPSFNQNTFTSTKSFESLPSNASNEPNNFSVSDNVKEKSFFNLGTFRRNEDKKLKPKYKNLRPNTFRLHAVEIHQYVPLPNLPTSRFVDQKMRTEQFKSDANSYFANCFFNPNSTGPVAPMMNNIMNGVNNYPDLYSMNSKFQRLNTQDLSVCVMPHESSNGFNQQNPLRLVE
ncbi:uncharacterized protein TA15755 [Theileria annulata]|uniref:Uncharacterized protein n=1 Tax=Theileria annulata TaxID=5874 RepID=Q4UFN6_THEAN|nr:uncharacterized protein TA15755 [Theileria annulata]CAI74080.1 hypothetical protein TA15755 [Theileria annulata]|eukprot:XP_951812.1 hypothetical protein TA15755 [Theileria annulata]